MKAKLKSGKVITGKLAETLTRLGLSKEVGKSTNLKNQKPKVAQQAKPKNNAKK